MKCNKVEIGSPLLMGQVQYFFCGDGEQMSQGLDVWVLYCWGAIFCSVRFYFSISILLSSCSIHVSTTFFPTQLIVRHQIMEMLIHVLEWGNSQQAKFP